MPFRRVQKTYDEASLYEYAIGALGRRMRSVAELKRLMRNKVGQQNHAELLVEVVIARLKQERYLNDTNYAETYTRLRKENEKFGRMRVAQDLKAKGVHGDIINGAISTAYADVNEEQLARDFLKRKRLAQPKTQRDAARVFRTLMRAGFSSRAIFRILKAWNVNDEVILALESEAAEPAGAQQEDH